MTSEGQKKRYIDQLNNPLEKARLRANCTEFAEDLTQWKQNVLDHAPLEEELEAHQTKQSRNATTTEG